MSAVMDIVVAIKESKIPWAGHVSHLADVACHESTGKKTTTRLTSKMMASCRWRQTAQERTTWNRRAQRVHLDYSGISTRKPERFLAKACLLNDLAIAMTNSHKNSTAGLHLT